jgi:hypothetical protein
LQHVRRLLGEHQRAGAEAREAQGADNHTGSSADAPGSQGGGAQTTGRQADTASSQPDRASISDPPEPADVKGTAPEHHAGPFDGIASSVWERQRMRANRQSGADRSLAWKCHEEGLPRRTLRSPESQPARGEALPWRWAGERVGAVCAERLRPLRCGGRRARSPASTSRAGSASTASRRPRTSPAQTSASRFDQALSRTSSAETRYLFELASQFRSADPAIALLGRRMREAREC